MKRMKFKILILILSAMTGLSSNAAIVKTELSGLEQGDSVLVSVSSQTFFSSRLIKANGSVDFHDVNPGLHSVKVEANGYNLPKTQLVRVNEDGSVDPMSGIKLVVTKMDEDPDNWHHIWESDGSVGGYTTTSNVNTRPEVEFLGKRIVPSDVPSMAILKEQYHIILVDEEMPWTQECAYRLLETLKTLPRDYGSLPDSKFILTEEKLTDDLNIQKEQGGNIVRISQDAFAYANPSLVNLDGVRGRFFSKRLHHAMTKFVTDFGEDKGAINQILDKRFGISVDVPDYKELTACTTNEDNECFQEFLPSELVAVINMFEELPEGFHVTPNLKYLVRRLNGHPHPIYKDAAAVAWCQENGYIEFMVSEKGSAFSGNNEQFDTQRLILHEKTHFLWAFTFSEEIRNDWAEIGGWYKDPNAGDDPDLGWSTTKTTEFVSAYAHAHNPNEDMAESVAFYLKDPEKLMSRAPEKYDFIRDRIMHGTRYISSIPDHLTFEVLNLYPDYDYPGKINKVDITVTGAPDEDKRVVMEISLNHVEGFQDDASGAFVRITSPLFKDQHGEKCSQFVDLRMSPVDGNGHILRGEAIVNNYSKAGYWTCGDIVVSDNVGNDRYEGRNDCVTNIYVNNPNEDLISPEYESGSLRYELTDGEEEGHKVQLLNIRYKVKDNIGMRSTFARVDNDYEGWSKGGTGLTDTYGTYNEETGEAEITYVIKEYLPAANYFVTFISTYDKAGTEKTVYFSDSPDHEKVQKIFINTPNPDYKAPEIDLNRMLVYAEPTHPENPDGETKVTVTFYARDNISGVGPMRYEFRDPQGNMHGDWFYHENFYSSYFEGDPTVWSRYQITHLLPRGSAPGIWGLAEMQIGDKAGNEQTYNFVETLIFEPDDSEDGWELFAEVEDASLIFGLNSDGGSNFGFTWRIIHEETGMEINGDSNGLITRSSVQLRADISSMPGGHLILIVQALGDESDVVAVKSRRIDYPGPFVAVESIVLQPSSLDCRVGGNIKVSATVLPDTASDKIVTWSSSDESVATVDENGEVTVLGVGKVTITASCGEVSSEFTLKCYPQIGDANWSGSITIADAVDISNYVMNKKIAPSDWNYEEWMEFYSKGANANESEDGNITIGDASAAVRLALEQPTVAATQNRVGAPYASLREFSDALVIGNVSPTKDGRTSVGINLDNTLEYVALQADIFIPDGTDIEVRTGSRSVGHSLETMRFDDNLIRVVLFNLSNKTFAVGEGAVLEIIADAKTMDMEGLMLSNIVAVDAEANEYALDSRMEVATGIESVNDGDIQISKVVDGIEVSNASGKRIDIWTIEGKTIKSFIAKETLESISLPSGIYIINAGDKTFKAIL